MLNYQGVASNVVEVNSSTQYLGNNAAAQAISDPFQIPSQLLSRLNSRFRVTVSGQINNGTTPGNVTLSSGGVPAAGVLLPALIIPAAATPVASTAYAFEATWEWVCQSPQNGNGYMQIRALIAQMGVWTDPVPLFDTIGAVALPFFQASHGGNVDAQYFFITAAIAQAASGTTTFTNYVKFDYTAGPQ